MKYDAAAFLESLFKQPAGLDARTTVDIRVEDLDPEWRVEWEERAAIMEYDGKLPRERAEAAALADIAGRIRRGEGFAARCSCRTCEGHNHA